VRQGTGLKRKSVIQFKSAMLRVIASLCFVLNGFCSMAAAGNVSEGTLTVIIDHVSRDGEISGSPRNEASRPVRIMAGSS
jgi:hypothetical protein